MGQPVDQQHAGTPIGTKNGVPALRLSHSAKHSDSISALPCVATRGRFNTDRIPLSYARSEFLSFV